MQFSTWIPVVVEGLAELFDQPARHVARELGELVERLSQQSGQRKSSWTGQKSLEISAETRWTLNTAFTATPTPACVSCAKATRFCLRSRLTDEIRTSSIGNS